MEHIGLLKCFLNLLLLQYPVLLASGWGSDGSIQPGVDTSHPLGHLQPLGAHRQPEGPIDTVEKFDSIDPYKFSVYQREGKPLIFKGASDIVPAYHKWTDEYLSEKYGSLQIETEEGKKENRSMGSETMPLSDFLKRYIKDDIYMVQDVLKPMKDDLVVPKPVVCGGYLDQLSTAVIWFSSGGTKSVLHSDTGLDNINCLLDGRKFLYMVDKKYIDKVKKDGWVVDGGYSSVDVEKVDMYKFPALQDLPWFSVTMEKGDCLFIPNGWFHAVNSTPPRNIAVNLWFWPLEEFKKSECDKMSPEIPLSLPLSNVEFQGSGGGYGQPDKPPSHLSGDELLRYNMFTGLIADDLSNPLDLKEFTRVLQGEAKEDDIKKLFMDVDVNNDGKISPSEIAQAPVQKLLLRYPWLSPSQAGGDAQASTANSGTDKSSLPDQGQPQREDL